MNGFIRGGGGTPNGGTAVLEGGVRTLEDTMIYIYIYIVCAIKLFRPYFDFLLFF